MCWPFAVQLDLENPFATKGRSKRQQRRSAGRQSMSHPWGQADFLGHYGPAYQWPLYPQQDPMGPMHHFQPDGSFPPAHPDNSWSRSHLAVPRSVAVPPLTQSAEPAGPATPAADTTISSEPKKSYHGQGKVVWHYVCPGDPPKIADGYMDGEGIEHRNWMGSTTSDVHWDNHQLDALKTSNAQKYIPKVEKFSDTFWVRPLDGEPLLLPFQTIESSLNGQWHQDPWFGHFYFVELPKQSV